MGISADPVRFLRRAFIALAVLLVAVQVIRVDRTNPPVTAPIQASAAVDSILRRSCYDCHSNETKWPWYSQVAPMSWLVSRDVRHGREHLNFSTWGEMTTDEQAKAVEEIWEEVEQGEMPLAIYTPLHPEARLSDTDKAALQAWAQSVAGMRRAPAQP